MIFRRGQYITSTGNVNSKGVEDAINDNWKGKVVQIPQFDLTCDTAPSGPLTTDCPAGNVGGHGSNQWYHLPQFAAFPLCSSTIPECMSNTYGKSFTQGAYVNGNNRSICDTGNGATSCLVGRFVSFIRAARSARDGVTGPRTGSGSSSFGSLAFDQECAPAPRGWGASTSRYDAGRVGSVR